MANAPDGWTPPRQDELRTPPHNDEAERSLLGAIFLENRVFDEVLAIVQPEDLYRESHRHIFRAMAALHARGDAIDVITVADYLAAEKLLDPVGGPNFLARLSSEIPSATNVSYYATIISRKASLRNFITTAHALIDECYNDVTDFEAFMDSAESKLFAITQSGAKKGYISMREVIKEAFAQIESLYQKAEQVTGVPSGFIDLDEITAGWQPSDLIIVAARPAMGKTALTLNMASHAAVERKVPVAYFSLEMANVQLAIRMLCSEARIDQSKLRTGRMTEQEWARLIKAAGTLSESPIYLDDTPALPIMEFRSKARLLKAEHDIGIIFIDYLQLMKATGKSIGSREQEISEISRNLKGIAKELQVPVIALAQLNRGVESRADKRPMNSDLRECVTGDTLVHLTDGRHLPIRELVGTQPEVWAVDEAGKLVASRSDKVWEVGEREVFKVTLATGRTITATAKHRLLTGDGWKRLAQLTPNSRIAITRISPEPSNPEVWCDERCALLGQMVGDGSYLKGQPMRYTSKSEENLTAVMNGVEALGCKWTRYELRGCSQVVMSGNGNRWHPAGVNAWFRELGIFNQRSHQKQLPESVFRLCQNNTATVLRHLWATDGCIHVRKGKGSHSIYYSTNSRKLAQDVMRLLARFGIMARLTSSQKADYQPQYSVSVSGKASQMRFLSEIGAFGPRREPASLLTKVLGQQSSPQTNVDTLPPSFFRRVKTLIKQKGISQREMARLRGTSYGGGAHFKFAPSRDVAASYAVILDDKELMDVATSDLFWDTVVSIEPVGREVVYDLTVPGPASWVANEGIVSHNSGAIEQDADIISFIYRDEVYNPESEHKGLAEFILGKHRNGGLGTVRLRFFGQYTRFENLAPEMAESLSPLPPSE